MSKPIKSDDPFKNGSLCPYCRGKTSYEDSSVVYRKSYGMIYICHPCRAYVGVHKGTDISLGRLANAELREWKKEAHLYFNKIFELGMMTRKEAYEWLGRKLNLEKNDTHIGMFNVDQCKECVYFSKQALNDNRRCDLDFGATPETPWYDTSEIVLHK